MMCKLKHATNYYCNKDKTRRSVGLLNNTVLFPNAHLKSHAQLYNYALQTRSIKLRGVSGEDYDEDEHVGDEWESLFGRTANTEAANARVFVDDFGTLHWPILLMYPEYTQTDLISQANETTRLVFDIVLFDLC